jgi:ribosomal protein S18 acetylase RimI-like enzyme
MDPDPSGLDIELGQFGENYMGAVVQLVACKGSKVVGSINLKHHSPNDGKITGFYIDSKYRGLRAGHMLLSETINRAKIAKLDGIYLDTWDKMETAVWLYKKFGWKQIEDRPKSSGAQRRYYLRLKKDNKSLHRIAKGLMAG